MKLSLNWIRQLHILALAGSFVLAAVLWFYVQLMGNYVWQLQIPLVVTNVKQGRVLKQPVPSSVRVQLEGPGSALMALRLLWSTQMQFVLNLETINKYWKCPTNRYLHWISFPQQLERVNIQRVITPDTIIVDLDNAGEKYVPIAGDNIVVNPRPGYLQVGTLTFQPESVTVSGPQSLLNDISSVHTVTHSYSEGAGAFTEEVNLALFKNPQIVLEPEKAYTFFTIERIGERVFEEIQVVPVNVKKGIQVRIEPQMVRVTLHGGEQFIRSLTPESITATIPYQPEWRRNKIYQRPVQITCPENVVHFEAVPGILNVVIE